METFRNILKNRLPNTDRQSKIWKLRNDSVYFTIPQKKERALTGEERTLILCGQERTDQTSKYNLTIKRSYLVRIQKEKAESQACTAEMRHTDIGCMPKEMGWSEQEIEITPINTLKAACESLHMVVIVSAFSYMHTFLRRFAFNASKTIHTGQSCGKQGGKQAFGILKKKVWVFCN